MRQHISYSQVNTWLECGHRYKLQYVDGIEQQPAWWTIGGKAIHSITEDIDNDVLYHSAIDEGIITRYIDVAYEETVGLIAQPFMNSKQDKDHWIKTAPEHIDRWVDFIANSTYSIIQNKQKKKAVELEIDVEIQGVQFRGYIDRIVSNPLGLMILDIKTGSKQPESPLQLAFYRYGLKKQYGIEVQRGGYFMTKNGKLLEYDLSKYTDEIIEDYITGLAKAKEHDLFLPNEGSGCFICPVKSSCAVYNIGVRK